MHVCGIACAQIAETSHSVALISHRCLSPCRRLLWLIFFAIKFEMLCARPPLKSTPIRIVCARHTAPLKLIKIGSWAKLARNLCGTWDASACINLSELQMHHTGYYIIRHSHSGNHWHRICSPFNRGSTLIIYARLNGMRTICNRVQFRFIHCLRCPNVYLFIRLETLACLLLSWVLNSLQWLLSPLNSSICTWKSADPVAELAFKLRFEWHLIEMWKLQFSNWHIA